MRHGLRAYEGTLQSGILQITGCHPRPCKHATRHVRATPKTHMQSCKSSLFSATRDDGIGVCMRKASASGPAGQHLKTLGFNGEWPGVERRTWRKGARTSTPHNASGQHRSSSKCRAHQIDRSVGECASSGEGGRTCGQNKWRKQMRKTPPSPPLPRPPLHVFRTLPQGTKWCSRDAKWQINVHESASSFSFLSAIL